LSLGLPVPALALREPEAAESHSLAGLEEALRSGEPRQVAQAVTSGLQQIFLPTPGRPEADPFSAIGLEETVDRLIGRLFPGGRWIFPLDGSGRKRGQVVEREEPLELTLSWTGGVQQRTGKMDLDVTLRFDVLEGSDPPPDLANSIDQYQFRLLWLEGDSFVEATDYLQLAPEGWSGARNWEQKFSLDLDPQSPPPVFALEVYPLPAVIATSRSGHQTSATLGPSAAAAPAALQFPPERDLDSAQTYAELTADPDPSHLHDVQFVGPVNDEAVEAGSTEFIELPEGGVGIPWEQFARWRMEMHILQPGSEDGVGGFSAFIRPRWEEPAGVELNVIPGSPSGTQRLPFELTQAADRYVSSSGFLHVEVVPGRAVYMFPVDGPLWIERLPAEVPELAELLLERLDLPHASLREHAVNALVRLDYEEEPELRDRIWRAFFRRLIPPSAAEESTIEPEENHRVRAALMLGLDWLSVTQAQVRATQEALRQLADNGDESGHADVIIERALERLTQREAILSPERGSVLLPPTQDVRLEAADSIELIGQVLAQSLWPIDYYRRIQAVEVLARHPDTAQVVSLLLGRLDPDSGEQEAEIRQAIVQALSGRRYSDPDMASQVRANFMGLLLPVAVQSDQASEANQQTRLLLLRGLEPLSRASGPEGVRGTLSFLERLSREAATEPAAVNNHRTALQRLLSVDASEFDQAEAARQFQLFLDEMRQTVEVFHGAGVAAQQANSDWADLAPEANLLLTWLEAEQAVLTVPIASLMETPSLLLSVLATLDLLEKHLAEAIEGSLTAQALHVHFGLPTANAGAYLGWLSRTRWELERWQERLEYIAGQEEARILDRLTGHQEPIRRIAYSRDGQLLASASLRKAIRIWSGTPGEMRGLQSGIVSDALIGADSILDIALSPARQFIALADYGGAVLLYQIESGAFHKRLGEDHSTEPARSVVFSPDGDTVASSDGRNIKMWDFATGALSKTYTAPVETGETILNVVFSPDGSSLAYATYKGGEVRLLDLATEQDQSLVERQAKSSGRIAFSPDGRWLASSAGEDDFIFIWDVVNDKTHKMLREAGYQHRPVTFSPDSRFVASGTAKGNIQFWNVESGDVVGTIVLETASRIRNLLFHPNDQGVIASSIIGGKEVLVLATPDAVSGAGQEEGDRRQFLRTAGKVAAVGLGTGAALVPSRLSDNVAVGPAPQFIPSGVPGLNWELIQEGVPLDAAASVSQEILLAAQPNLRHALQAHFPDNHIASLPNAADRLAGALEQIHPRLIFLDQGLMTAEEAQQALPEQHPPAFLLWQTEAEALTPPVAAAILRLQREGALPAQGLFIFRIRQNELGSTVLDLYA